MEQTPYEFIKARITQAFVDLAEELAHEPDVPVRLAAGLPIELFRAQQHLLAAWDEFAGGPGGDA